jgi:hypothetical protein
MAEHGDAADPPVGGPLILGVREFGDREMPKVSDHQRLLDLYRRGVLTELEAANRIIELAVESDVNELVSHLPPELLMRVQRAVAEAPTTEDGWGQLIYIWAGSNTPECDPEATRERMRAAHRSGIDALRRHFGRGPGDA